MNRFFEHFGTFGVRVCVVKLLFDPMAEIAPC